MLHFSGIQFTVIQLLIQFTVGVSVTPSAAAPATPRATGADQCFCGSVLSQFLTGDGALENELVRGDLISVETRKLQHENA